MAGLAGVLALIGIALAAPLVVSLAGVPGPTVPDAAALDPRFGAPSGPSGAHPLGVDELGRDLLARVVYGSRVALLVAFLATLPATVVGVLAGLLAGYYRGWIDAVVSRLVDTVLAFPILLLALGLGTACAGRDGCLGGRLEPGLGLVVVTIGAVTWTGIARIVRGQVLVLREQEFVESARAQGASDRQIMIRELLPNLAAPIIVAATVALPAAVLFESALSFLGVGVQPPDPSWGQMLAQATESFDTAWWLMLFPGLALLLTVLAFTLLGEGLQDALGARTSMTPGPWALVRRRTAAAAGPEREDRVHRTSRNG